MTPDALQTVVKKPSSEIKCPEGDHPVRLKQLIKLSFSVTKSTEEKHRFQCGVCSKTLTNAVKTVALRRCGHVICGTCAGPIKKEGLCPMCSQKFNDGDVIPLQTGGTGYAGSLGEKLTAKVVTPTAWL